MRQASGIWESWDSSNFVGYNKAIAFVTVELNVNTEAYPMGWKLDTVQTNSFSTETSWPTPDRTGPWRFYQPGTIDLGNQRFVPNVKSISIDRSIDTDAASCNIVMYNSGNAGANWTELELSQAHGFFSYNRGNSAEAQARWGHEANGWNNVLTPMALIRTYQGFGWPGWGIGELDVALANSKVVLTGTWFVDKVTVGTDGMLSLNCRDAGKLLIEQQLLPPLTPASISPLKYYRWKDETYSAIWDPGAGLGPRGISGGRREAS